MKPSLCFYVNEQKKSSKNGLTPIYVRILLKGQKSEGRLYEADLKEKEKLLWDSGSMRLRTGSHKVNKLINGVQASFDEFIILNGRNLNSFTAHTIRDLLLGRNKRVEPSATVYIDNFYASTVENNPNLEISTKKCYQKAMRHFAKFLQLKNKQHLLVRDVTASIALEFKDYLLCQTGEGPKKGMTEVSALGNIKKFRTIFDRAVEEGYLDRNPFKQVKLKNRSSQKPRLTLSQISALYKLDLTKYPRLIVYRDLFLFSCFTGLAYEDAHHLSYSDLISIGSGELKIYLSREKTDILTEVVLVSYAKQIVEKYRKEPENQITMRALPQRSNQKINFNLKILSNLIEIPFELSSHLARHTFRQLLGEADITDIGVIKRMMGHSRNGDIDGFYYRVTEEKLTNAKEKLQLLLSKHFDKSAESSS